MGTILEVDPDNLPPYEWDWGVEGEEENTDGAPGQNQPDNNKADDNKVDASSNVSGDN